MTLYYVDLKSELDGTFRSHPKIQTSRFCTIWINFGMATWKRLGQRCLDVHFCGVFWIIPGSFARELRLYTRSAIDYTSVSRCFLWGDLLSINLKVGYPTLRLMLPACGQSCYKGSLDDRRGLNDGCVRTGDKQMPDGYLLNNVDAEFGHSKF